MTNRNDQERALFEAAILKVWPSCPVHVVRDLLPPDDPQYGAYVDQDIRAAWVGWQARAQLPEGGAVPEGWRLVPIVPTDAMVKAGIATPCIDSGSDADDEPQDYRNMYSAMLTAAPHPVSGEQKSGIETLPCSYCGAGAHEPHESRKCYGESGEQPAAQDVSGLVEALRNVEQTSSSTRLRRIAREALAAQAQGGDV